MSLSKNLALAFSVSFLIEVTPAFSDSFTDEWNAVDVSVWGTWHDDAWCITVFSVSSDFVTLLGDAVVFCARKESPIVVRFGEFTLSFIKDSVSASQTVSNFILEIGLDSIPSSSRSGVVSPMACSISDASSVGDFAMSCVMC